MRFLLIVALATSLIASPSNAGDKPKKISKQLQQLLAMTPAEFQASATLKDDYLETAATITTQNGWQERQGLLKIVNNDAYFRAFIDKRTGQTKFQVYEYVTYVGDWAFFNAVNYETENGPVSTELDVLGRDVGTCSKWLGGCEHTETVAFAVDEDLLRSIASRYVPGAKAGWHYRLKAKSGVQRDEVFVAAEVGGLLAAVDAYKAQHGLMSPAS
jgi:hypothetical protein